MSGRVQWEAQINSNVANLLQETKSLRNQLDGIKNGKYNVKLNVDDEKLKNVISNLDKMLTSLSKGTGNFKQFENLSKELTTIHSQLTEINNSYSNINGNTNLNNLLSSVQNIDKSLLLLNEHISNVNSNFGNVGKNVNEVNNMTSATEKLTEATKKASSEQRNTNINKSSKTNTSEIEKNKKVYQELVNTIQQYSKVSKNIARGKYFESDIQEAEKLKIKIEALQKQPILSATQIEESKQKLNSLAQSLNDIQKNSSFKFVKGLDSQIVSYQNSLNKFSVIPEENRFEAYNTQVNSLKTQLLELQTLRQNLTITNGIVSPEDQQKIQSLTSNIDGLIKKMSTIPQAQRGWKDVSTKQLAETINSTLTSNIQLSKQARIELQSLYNELASGKPSKPLAEIEARMHEIVQSERAAGRAGRSWLATFKDKSFYGFIGQMQSYLSMYVGFYGMVRQVKAIITTITELDTALIDLKKTTSMTDTQLEDFYYTSNDVAKQMGVTTKEIIEQAAAWSRLGYSTQEASTTMAELSSQFSSISPGMDTAEAQSGLVSIMKAWSIDPDQVKSEIMDPINTLGNNFALSNKDIIEGMQRSAAALSAVGTDYKDAFALFVGAQEVMQNAEKTGTALRSVSMRVRGFDENSEDGLEETSAELQGITGDLINLTKTAQHSQGVSIFKEGSITEFKSLVDYFGEINAIWDEMTQKQQNDFLTKAFGKVQAQAGASLIKNFDAVKDSIAKMEGSLGSSDREMSIIEESIEYKTNALKETWTGISQSLVERGTIGSIVDGLTKISEAIGTIVDKAGMLGTIGIGAGLFAGIKNFGRLKMFSLF